MAKILANPENCTGCGICMLACSVKKENVHNPRKARVVIKVDWPNRPKIVVCGQCEEPAPCEEVCPTRAIFRDEKTGILTIKTESCIGCENCVGACTVPGAIFMHPEKRIAVKCDVCGGNPFCVKYCLTKSLEFRGV